MCIKKINKWFDQANRADVNELLSKVILTERQTRIFEMFYLKRQDVGFIADKLCFSQDTINKELRKIREIITPFIS